MERIDLRGLTDVRKFSDLSITQEGMNTVININNNQKIILSNINKYDFVYCFMTRTTLYIINHPNKKIHNSIDSMYINYSNSISLTKSLFWKLIYTIEIPLLYRFEKSVVKNFDCNN